MFLLLLFIETGIDTLHELLNTIKDDAYHFRLAFKIWFYDYYPFNDCIEIT